MLKQYNHPIDKIEVEYFIVKENYGKKLCFHKKEFKSFHRRVGL